LQPRWSVDPAEEIALVARARREVMLRAYRNMLRREDLEDCLSQAVCELLARGARGQSFVSREHVANALEQRFLSRVYDRRRALRGRSPLQAALENALPLGCTGEQRIELADPRAEVLPLVAHRFQLRQVARLAPLLTPDHAGWYVEEVESWAAKYSASAPSASSADIVESAAGVEGALAGADTRLASGTATPVRFIPGERALLDPGDGHVALVPAGVPATVQAMVVAGNELQDLPYGPDGHPNPLGAPEEDCSSTVNYVLYRAGVRPLAEIVRDNPLAQDYVHWGAPGPGRWVTIYAADTPTPHVFIVIAGLRLDTSHNGTDVGPNRDENGPRWRILDDIPTWAHWSVRHPPGL
jgi:hypothetical protein